MALWNELIPRLHRPDDFETRFHLLDDHENETLFDDASYPGGIPIATLSDGAFHQPRQRSAATPSGQNQTAPTAVKYVMNESPVVVVTSRSTIPSVYRVSTEPLSPSSSSSTRPQEHTHFAEYSTSAESLPVHDITGSRPTLLLTVGVGCCLFALNAIVFLIVMCQWRALRLARAARIAKNSQSAAALLVGGNGINGGHYVPFDTSGCAESVSDAAPPTSHDRYVRSPTTLTASTTTMATGNGLQTYYDEKDNSEMTRLSSDDISYRLTTLTSRVDESIFGESSLIGSTFRYATITSSQTGDESREMRDATVVDNHHGWTLSHESSLV